MSDSSSAAASPSSHSTYEDALRNAVRNIYKTGNLENLTVKRIRKAAEQHLDLEQDYFKNDPTWKEKSKIVIQSEVDAHADPQSSPIAPVESSSLKVLKIKAKPSPNGREGVPYTDARGSKRQQNDGSDRDDNGHEPKKRKSRKAIGTIGTKTKGTSSTNSDSVGEENVEAESVSEAEEAPKSVRANNSESEMSEVLDEGPKPKRRPRGSGSEKVSSKMKTKAAKASKESQPMDPDAEEIKRLQGWLVKCGIRKMWWKELQSYDSPKAKIRHLKDMLVEAGMTGRFSVEKAAQIKEQRELKADLEAVQAGNKSWGMDESPEDGDGRPRRKLAKGFKDLEFLDDAGEETD